MANKPMPVINIIDVNNLLHIGNHRFRNYSIKDVNGFPIKTGGMYMVLNLLRKRSLHHLGNTWIFCFDRQSFRRNLSSQMGIGYKSSRSKMSPELRAQADELYKWLPEIGYNAMAVDGLESDDIITSLARIFKDAPVKINIFSTDRDLAMNITDRCELVSSNGKVPTVTRENYEYTVAKSKGRVVYYNSILLYKVICGDDSDGIPPISREAYTLYLTLIKKLQSLNFPLEKLSEFEAVEGVIKMLSPELQQKAFDNWELVKPHLIPSEHFVLNPQKINEEKLYEFCSIFGMKSIANKFGITLTEYPETVTKYRVDLYKRIATMKEGSIEEDTYDDRPEDNLTDLERLETLKKIKTESLVDIPEENQSPVEEVGNSISEEINQVD